MVEINLLIADKLWRNNNDCVIIIAFMSSFRSNVILIRFCSIQKAKTQSKYVPYIKPDILLILIPNPARTRTWPKNPTRLKTRSWLSFSPKKLELNVINSKQELIRPNRLFLESSLSQNSTTNRDISRQKYTMKDMNQYMVINNIEEFTFLSLRDHVISTAFKNDSFEIRSSRLIRIGFVFLILIYSLHFNRGKECSLTVLMIIFSNHFWITISARFFKSHFNLNYFFASAGNF